MVIVTVFYICLSFAHPDYWIARYNLNPAHIEYLNKYDVADSKRYLSGLSADAAPVLLDQEKNPYLETNPAVFADTDESSEYLNDRTEYTITENSGINEISISWLKKYYNRIDELSQNTRIRNFNFSVYRAGKYL